MTRKGAKQEPPLHLDLDFGEALERFARTKPTEVAEIIERSKKAKPPGGGSPGGAKALRGPRSRRRAEPGR
jgi:hypothetical protein